MKKEHTELEDIIKRLEVLEKKITKLKTEKDTLLIKRNEVCDCLKLESKSYYCSGSYLETGYEERWEECIICHKKFNKVVKSTGSYN